MIFTFIMGSLLYSNFKGAPWVKSPKKSIDEIIKIIQLPNNARIIELGCGTGEVLRTLCRDPKTIGVGVDINPFLIFLARIQNRLKNSTTITFKVGNVYECNISSANVIYVFLMPKMLQKLVPKFEKELKKGTLIISLGFKIPGWDIHLFKTKTVRPYPIYQYKV